ncbi:MAG TPA: hypothetical protein VGG19_04765 [Tepidisphaeraceae bacterium]|jgi:integrase
MSRRAPTPPTNTKHRLRRHLRQVRPHVSGKWTVCIGKKLSKDGKKTRPKDWYFSGTEADANAMAEKVQKKWSFIVSHWKSLYRPRLVVEKSLFADQPHWPAPLSDSIGPSDAAVTEFIHENEFPSAEEISEAHAEVTLKGVFNLYKQELKIAVINADKGNTTSWTDEKNVRCAMGFFDDTMRLDALTETQVKNAKTRMLTKLARRTARNYLDAFKRMLLWFYNSDYGHGWQKPANFDKVFMVANAMRTNIEIPSIPELKTILVAADEWQRLHIMLALNCGMYQADIGRLTLSVVNIDEGYIFWDREKEPDNPFKIRHNLWPETLTLVKKFIQRPSRRKKMFDDYRGYGPTQIDCTALAFVDAGGNPLYRIRENGKAYDKIAKVWQKLNAKLKKADGPIHQFKNLRKATNQVLTDLLNNKIEGDDQGQLIAIQEISNAFLGHKTTQLVRLYETRGVKGFARLNKYLKEVGDELWRGKVFNWQL